MASLLGPYHAQCKNAGKQWTGSWIVNAGILKWPLDMCYLRGDARLPKHAIGLSYTHNTPKLPLNSTVVKILAILWNWGYPIFRQTLQTQLAVLRIVVDVWHICRRQILLQQLRGPWHQVARIRVPSARASGEGSEGTNQIALNTPK